MFNSRKQEERETGSPTVTDRYRFMRHFASATLAIGCLAVGTPSLADEDNAMSILKAMSDYVGSQQTIELAFDSDIEIITPGLEKIQFTNSGSALLKRPDKLHAHRTGGYSDVEMIFDGKTLSIDGKSINGYAQIDAEGTVDELIEMLRAGHGVALPGADLLLTNSYEKLAAGVLEAKHIGRGIIGWRECEHLAFRNFDTDWQIWVEAGDKPAPCKMVVTSKTINNAPQYSVTITGWKTGIDIPDDSFVFVAPAGAEELGPDDLLELDELPPSASGGAQ
ncbi:MAG: DUF2092 domain-containing protein [Chromatiales bacterium]|jgi:hypothetical protein